jgi:hypothetical protein
MCAETLNPEAAFLQVQDQAFKPTFMKLRIFSGGAPSSSMLAQATDHTQHKQAKLRQADVAVPTHPHS